MWRVWLLRYLVENFDDLLALDLKLARILGAPAPHTLSSWAYEKSPFWTKIIDWAFLKLLGQRNHCKGAKDGIDRQRAREEQQKGEKEAS
jgi:hypothetical protein